MLDDADFERLGKLIELAVDRRAAMMEERITLLINTRMSNVEAILDAQNERQRAFARRLTALETSFTTIQEIISGLEGVVTAMNQGLIPIDGRLALLDEQVRELRTLAIQTRDKQRETYALVTQIWDNLKGLYSRDMDHDARLDVVEQIIRRWGTPPAQPQG